MILIYKKKLARKREMGILRVLSLGIDTRNILL